MTTTETKRWYVLRVASNREEQVQKALENKVKIENLTDIIGRILVPIEHVKRKGPPQKGSKDATKRKLYPGYVLVEMDVNSDGAIPERAYYLFKETQGVGDFLGEQNKPTPMETKDIDKILTEMDKPDAGPTVRVDFKKGDAVRIKEGAFENFEGTVDEVLEKDLVRVIVTIFGRATPLELEYWLLERVEQ